MNIFDKAIEKVGQIRTKTIAKREQMQINDKGEMSPNKIIGLAISVIVASSVLPDAIATLFAVNTTEWSSGAAALWDALPLIIIAAIVLAYYTTKKGD
jgi:hypothetical protein